MKCVDCNQEKFGKDIISSWNYGANREFACLCIECNDKRHKPKMYSKYSITALKELSQ